jgi:hypothetical protein
MRSWSEARRDADGVAQTEADHFGNYPVCGGLIDMRDLGQVLAHVHDARIEDARASGPSTPSIVKHDPGFARKYLPEKRQILEVLQKANDRLRRQAWASLQQAEEDLGLTNFGNKRL